tara:strand:- start:14568 stop:15785 length:1218 start_codon:yes stop_codon:yes gene_type:complete
LFICRKTGAHRELENSRFIRSVATALGILALVVLFVWRNQGIILGMLDGFTSFNMQMGGDSGRYLDGADRLLRGDSLVGKQNNYVGYISIVALVKASGIPLQFVAIFHLILMVIAGACVFMLGKAVWNSGAGMFAALLFFENPDLAIWNEYLLTDSLYSYLVVMVSYILHRTGKSGGLWHGILWPMLLVTASVRPNGWILFPVAGVFLSMIWAKNITTKSAAITFVCISFLTVALLIPSFKNGIEYEHPVAMFSKGTVIWGYKGWDIAMPTLDKVSHGWEQGIMVAIKYPLDSAKLAITRIGAELIRVRPYYPRRMNIRLGVEVGTIYLLAFLGAIYVWRNKVSKLILLVVVAHLLILGLTFASYDGRFLLYFFPLIIVMAGAGMSHASQLLYARLTGIYRVGRS